jgi:hypothetical protein
MGWMEDPRRAELYRDHPGMATAAFTSGVLLAPLVTIGVITAVVVWLVS